jgi:hypothetical protein
MLVAATLLSIGLVGGIEVVALCAKTSGGLEDRTRAMIFARSKMDEVLKEPVLQVGTDQGQGVDTSTDYDWVVTIEQTQSEALYSIAVEARNRITGKSVILTALRRPDIQPPAAQDGTTSTTSSTSGTGAAAR